MEEFVLVERVAVPVPVPMNGNGPMPPMNGYILPNGAPDQMGVQRSSSLRRGIQIKSLQYPLLSNSTVNTITVEISTIGSIDVPLGAPSNPNPLNNYTFEDEVSLISLAEHRKKEKDNKLAARTARALAEKQAEEMAEHAEAEALLESQRLAEERKKQDAVREQFERQLELQRQEQARAVEAARPRTPPANGAMMASPRGAYEIIDENPNQYADQWQNDGQDDDNAPQSKEQAALRRFESIAGVRNRDKSSLLLSLVNHDLERAVSEYIDSGSNIDDAINAVSRKQAGASRSPSVGSGARIDIITPDKQKHTINLAPSDTLWSVYTFVAERAGAWNNRAFKLVKVKPRREEYTENDLDKTLSAAGLVPQGEMAAEF